MLSITPVEGMSDLAIRLAVSAALLLLVTAHSVRCTGDTCYNGGGVQEVSLAPGQFITSRNGRVMLVLQTDGDLVVKCTDTWRPIWHSGTGRRYVNHMNRAVLQRDGNLAVLDYRGVAIYNSNSQHRGGAMLVVQDDGNVVMYSNYGRAVWDTRTRGHCGDTVYDVIEG